MPLRPARVDDLPVITTIYAAAFYNEEFMGALLHPHRQSYPQDYRRYWENKVREWYWDYSHQLLVTYTVNQTDEVREELVTGVGDWIRHGKGWESYWGVWGKWDPRNIIKRVVLLRHRISLYWHPNRAADPAIHDILTTIFSYTKHLWSGKRDTGWYLNYLAVDPAYQNQGYGRILAAWGIEQAKQENVAASVISGKGKQTFYRRCGFEFQGGRVSDGEGNPLKGKVEGGTVLFCDPMAE